MKKIMAVVLIAFAINVCISAISGNSCSTEPRCQCKQHVDGLEAVCRNLKLKSLPTFSENVTGIDLSFNEIEYFPEDQELPTNLKRLDLSNNKLRSFNGTMVTAYPISLPYLIYLNVSGNQIELTRKVYYENVFIGMQQLEILDISNNTREVDAHEYPGSAFQHLICLKQLNIDGIENAVFGRKFLNLQNLTTLNLKGNCDLKLISKNFFENLPFLKELDISFCSLKIIESGAVSSLTHLRMLDLSHNKRLGICGLINVTRDLQYTAIDVLKASFLHCPYNIGIGLFVNDVKPLQNTSLRELYFNGNHVEMMENMAPSYLPESLEKIEAQRNRWHVNFYLEHFQHLRNLRTLDVSNNDEASKMSDFSQNLDCNDFLVTQECVCTRQKSDKINTFSVSNVLDKVEDVGLLNSMHGYLTYESTKHLSPLSVVRNTTEKSNANVSTLTPLEKCMACSNGHFFPIPVPKNLNHLILSNTQAGYFIPRIFMITDTVINLNLSHNRLNYFLGPICHVARLEILDLSYNQCKKVYPGFFCGFTGVKRLYLNNNYLGDVLRNNTSCSFFTEMGKLQYLDMSNNKIISLCDCLFQSLLAIQGIDLSSNLLTEWNIPIDKMMNITMINLANNQINYLNKPSMDLLTPRFTEELVLDLSDNPFRCECEALSFFQWILSSRKVNFKNKQYYKCTMNDGSKMNITKAATSLRTQCASRLLWYIISACVVASFCTALIVGFAYKYRWKIRYWYYLAKKNNYKSGYQRLHDNDNDYKFDAFVSYCESDRDFVHTELLRVLETEHGFNCCVHERDFIPGCNIAQNIVNAIHNSRRTICIVTEDFTKSTWCMYEFNIGVIEGLVSRNGSNVVLLVFMSYEPNSCTPKNLLKVINNNTYIEVPVSMNDRPVFWSRIVASLSE